MFKILLLLAGIGYAGGSLVGNGSGLAEQEFIYAYEKLPQNIEFCLQTSACNIDDQEFPILMKINKMLRNDLSPIDKLFFASEKQLPGFFTTNDIEYHRIAKTDAKKHAIIFINRDALYKNGNAVVDYPTATAVLIHELGHQVGELDHKLLDKLGIKIRAHLEKIKSVHPYPSKKNNLKIVTYNAQKPDIYSDMILYHNQESYDLSKKIEGIIDCKTDYLIGYSFLNSYWSTVEPLVFNSLVSYTCQGVDGGYQEISAEIAFSFELKEGKLSLLNIQSVVKEWSF